MTVNCLGRNLQKNFREALEIQRDGVRGKKFFSPEAEDRITENFIMVAASFINRQKQVNKDMVNIRFSRRTFFNINSVPEMGLKLKLENVDPLIKRLFSSNKVLNIPIAGKLKHFSNSWKELARH